VTQTYNNWAEIHLGGGDTSTFVRHCLSITVVTSHKYAHAGNHNDAIACVNEHLAKLFSV